ncbi:MAG: hypothetical protein O7H40_01630 [Gammaproteobacteria bacterium]|nr:hypothetical protein [Gammaproteobacteria bacterium]
MNIETMNRSGDYLAESPPKPTFEETSTVQAVPEAPSALEWVELEPGKIIVATGGRAWLHQPAFLGGADPFTMPMQSAGSLDSTRNLLEGAVAAAQRPALDSAQRPALTLLRWVWRLAGYYHTTHATPPLMGEAAELFSKRGRDDLAAYSREKVRDETGHDKLALADLKSLGYPAEEVVKILVPPTAQTLVDYFEDAVRGAHAIRCIGYAYALERLATSMDGDYVAKVEALIPEGVRATRCLRLHSGIGADVDHVEDAVEVTARQPAEDRARIVRATYETARIMFTAPPEGHVSEEALQERLSAIKHRH